ncbi:nuclear transport factor 2 family protein [Streptomyces sp. NPDC058417]|uniref:nuclear transport factor 2 family protein n=1 Tax=unclassified Streptomyces TaxID=2593676 RepID=UPI0036588619
MTGTAPASLESDAQEAAERMVRDLCEAVDAHDFDRFGAYFTDTASYRFGNAEPLRGRAAIVAATAGAVAAIPPVRHRVDQVVRHGDQLFCRFTIEVAAPAGPVAMPCVTVVELAPGRHAGEDAVIVDYRVHMDIAPALQAAEAARA